MNDGCRIVIASDSNVSIQSIGNVSDAVSTCIGTAGLILTHEDLSPDFFNLRSGLAGELFQKFTNYRIRVAVVLPDPAAYGERLAELIHEHQAHPLIRFVSTKEEAINWLRRKEGL